MEEKQCVWKLHTNGFHTVKYVRLDVTDITTIQAAKDSETIDLAEGKSDSHDKHSSFFSLINPLYTKQQVDSNNHLLANWRTTRMQLLPLLEPSATQWRPFFFFFGLVQNTMAFLPLEQIDECCHARTPAFTLRHTIQPRRPLIHIPSRCPVERKKVSKWTQLCLDLPVPSWIITGKMANRRRLVQALGIQVVREKDEPTFMGQNGLGEVNVY